MSENHFNVIECSVYMVNVSQIINEITETLKQEGVEKVILFGSYASGEPGDDSDLDIIIVTGDDYIPATNREKMELHHKYNVLIRKFRKLLPIDLLVYTRLMYSKLQESGSQFSKELNRKSKVLYETANKGLA